MPIKEASRVNRRSPSCLLGYLDYLVFERDAWGTETENLRSGVVATSVIVPSPKKKVIWPALPCAMYQFSTSIRSAWAPLRGGVSEERWLHSDTVMSPTPPLSNSIHPQNPPGPVPVAVTKSSQRDGLMQLPEKPICQIAVFPYA